MLKQILKMCVGNKMNKLPITLNYTGGHLLANSVTKLASSYRYLTLPVLMHHCTTLANISGLKSDISERGCVNC